MNTSLISFKFLKKCTDSIQALKVNPWLEGSREIELFLQHFQVETVNCHNYPVQSIYFKDSYYIRNYAVSNKSIIDESSLSKITNLNLNTLSNTLLIPFANKLKSVKTLEGNCDDISSFLKKQIDKPRALIKKIVLYLHDIFNNSFNVTNVVSMSGCDNINIIYNKDYPDNVTVEKLSEFQQYSEVGSRINSNLKHRLLTTNNSLIIETKNFQNQRNPFNEFSYAIDKCYASAIKIYSDGCYGNRINNPKNEWVIPQSILSASLTFQNEIHLHSAIKYLELLDLGKCDNITTNHQIQVNHLTIHEELICFDQFLCSKITLKSLKKGVSKVCNHNVQEVVVISCYETQFMFDALNLKRLNVFHSNYCRFEFLLNIIEDVACFNCNNIWFASYFEHLRHITTDFCDEINIKTSPHIQPTLSRLNSKNIFIEGREELIQIKSIEPFLSCKTTRFIRTSNSQLQKESQFSFKLGNVNKTGVCVEKNIITNYKYSREKHFLCCPIPFTTEKYTNFISTHNGLVVCENPTIHYYEVTILPTPKQYLQMINLYIISIGFLNRTTYSSYAHVGWEKGSIGFHSDDGRMFHENGHGKAFDDPFFDGDIIGCGFIPHEQKVFFTRNGSIVNNDFIKVVEKVYYPSIVFNTAYSVSVNFGETPFAFDLIEEMQHHQ
ncbi:B30.2/SPRY domain-containing protein [Entamoeba marina]